MTKEDVRQAAKNALDAATAITHGDAIVIVMVRPRQAGEPISIAHNVVNDPRAVEAVVRECANVVLAGHERRIIMPGAPS